MLILTKQIFDNSHQSVSHSVSQSISKHQVKPNNTMVKINTTEFRKQLSSRPTKTSVFMKFLTKISFFPITLDEAEGVIRFKLISKKTLAHVLIYWGLLLLIMSIMGAQMDVKVLSTIAEQNVFETFSIMAGNISYISIMFPLLLCSGLNNMDIRMVWKERLPFPKHGVKAIVTHFGTVIGYFAAFWGYLTPLDIPLETTERITSASLLCRNCLSSGNWEGFFS